MASDYLTPQEPAEYLRTLAKRRLYKQPPKYSRIGTAIRYRKADLDEFMALNQMPSPSENGGEGGRR
jgi:hypothetical protein